MSYVGSGSYATTYHSEPPNTGGAHDTNDASDSSTQRWSLKYVDTLRVPNCVPGRGSRAKRCQRTKVISGARGQTRATGRVSHVHVDGLYPAQDASVRCQLAAHTPASWLLHATVGLRYLPHSPAMSITAFDPVIDAINILPGQCPSQGDPLDGLYDNYFIPGFSFAKGYGPKRWFRPVAIVIPLSVIHRARTITIPLALTPKGTPPRSCAVRHPAYERCTTGGSWSGVLRLTAVR